MVYYYLLIRESEMLNQTGRQVYFSRCYFNLECCRKSWSIFIRIILTCTPTTSIDVDVVEIVGSLGSYVYVKLQNYMKFQFYAEFFSPKVFLWYFLKAMTHFPCLESKT